MDDVRLWNTARSEFEIAANKDAELNGNEAGLVGYWKLNTLSDTLPFEIFGGFSSPREIAHAGLTATEIVSGREA